MDIKKYRSLEDRDQKSEKVLRAAWLLSLWAPLSTGIAYYLGQSSVLLADFLRRSNELLALWLSWYIFRIARELEEKGQPEEARKKEKKSSLFMAAVMFLSGAFVFYSAWNSYVSPKPLGWILPGILVATGGLIVNSYFWYKNWSLSRLPGRPILESQWRFYRAKTIIDMTVLLTLFITSYQVIGPPSWLADPIGALVVALFIWYSAIKILIDVVFVDHNSSS